MIQKILARNDFGARSPYLKEAGHTQRADWSSLDRTKTDWFVHNAKPDWLSLNKTKVDWFSQIRLNLIGYCWKECS